MVVNVGPENIWNLMDLRMCDRIGTGRPVEDPYRLRKYKAMIEEAVRAPISVKMLKIDGKGIMDLANIPPSPKVGLILNALMEEVLDDPKLNTKEYLEKQTRKLIALSDEELNKIAIRGREKKDEVEEEMIEEIRKKHHVK
jgi:poly(A) polymerase/tRNA nucleotidyltransferase (CCA-adding enzyme)